MQLRLCTWNVRFIRPGRDYQMRHYRLLQILDELQADVICLQEVGPMLLGAMRRRMRQYELYDVDRDGSGGLGEHLVCLLHRGRFRHVHWDRYWLGPHPHRAHRAYDAAAPRVVGELRLTVPSWPLPVRVSNIHLDHFGGRARLESARQLARHVQHSHALDVLTGDFNCQPGAPSYRQLVGSPPALHDARVHALHPPKGPVQTWRGPWPWRRQLDLILLDHRLCCVDYTTMEFPARWRPPSDHLPVLAHIKPTAQP